MSEPSSNPGVESGVGPDVSYLPTRLITAAERGGTVTFLSGDGPGDRVEWAVLHEEAKAMAVALARRGVGPGATPVVVADPMRAGFIQPEPGDPPVVLLPDLTGDASDPWAWEAPKEDPQSLALLQFTSGSTADPKGVMLPHATICANLDAIAAAAELDPDDDVLCSWLPLYHDMGLIGLLTMGMTTGTDLALASPQDFLASPGRWMQWMSDYG